MGKAFSLLAIMATVALGFVLAVRGPTAPPTGSFPGPIWTGFDSSPQAATMDGETKQPAGLPVVRVALADPLVRRVVGTRFTYLGESQWNESKNDIRVTLLLDRPRSIDAVLPYEDTTGDPTVHAPARCRAPSYVTGWLRIRATGLIKVWIEVDLETRRVVAIETSARKTISSFVPGKPHPWCPQPTQF